MNRLEGIRVLSRSEVAGLELLSVQRGNEVHAQNVRRHDSAPSAASCPLRDLGQPIRFKCSLTIRRFSRPRLSPERIRRRNSRCSNSDRGPSIPRRCLPPLTSLCPNGLRAAGARSAGSKVGVLRPQHLPEADRYVREHLSLTRKNDTAADSQRGLQHTPQPLGRIDDDFDFSAGLAAFDKKAVFADIKVRAPPVSEYVGARTDSVRTRLQSQDATDPNSRLHAHNRNPSRARTPQSKLLPSESVLSPQELYDQQQEVQILRDNKGTKIASMTPTDMHAGDVEESLGGGGGGGGADGEEQRNERRWQSVTGEIEKIALGGGGASTNGREGVLMTASGGRPVPVINGKQWREALSIAEVKLFQGVWSLTAC